MNKQTTSDSTDKYLESIIDIFIKEKGRGIIHLDEIILQYSNIGNLIYKNRQFCIHTGIEQYRKLTEDEGNKLKECTKIAIDRLLNEINQRNTDTSKSYIIYTMTEEEYGYNQYAIVFVPIPIEPKTEGEEKRNLIEKNQHAIQAILSKIS